MKTMSILLIIMHLQSYGQDCRKIVNFNIPDSVNILYREFLQKNKIKGNYYCVLELNDSKLYFYIGNGKNLDFKYKITMNYSNKYVVLDKAYIPLIIHEEYRIYAKTQSNSILDAEKKEFTGRDTIYFFPVFSITSPSLLPNPYLLIVVEKGKLIEYEFNYSDE